MTVSQNLIDNVNDIKTTLNEISVYNLDVKTAIELYYELAKKVNEVINELSRFEGVVSDEVIKQNEKLIYLLGEGLKVQVGLKIDELIKNGTIQDLINNKIFNELNSKIDNFKQEVNEQFNTIAINFKSTVEQENVKLGDELLTTTGWTSDGWTGSFATGFTHTTGTLPLKYNLGNIQGKMLKVEFTLTNVSGGSGAITSYNDFSLSIGGTPTFEVYEGSFDEHTFSYGLVALTNDDLIITPRNEWVGTIKNISVKEIVGGLESTLKIKDSDNNVSFEITNTKKELNNVFIGQEVGKKNIRGNKNVAIGGNSLKNNTTGFWNTAIGYGTLEQNLIGTRNVAIGLYAMRENLYGDRNVALGTYALHRNTEGRNNIALGADTLWNNTTGNNNIGISNCALDHNTTGTGNISLGYYSLYNNTTGNANIGIGVYSLNANTTGRHNTAIGEMAMYKNTTGIYNIAFGTNSLQQNTTGEYNIAIGNDSIKNKTVGDSNIGIGRSSMLGITSGTGNVSVGVNSCGASGNGKINRNVCLGVTSGAKLQNGASKNILIGGSCGGNITTGSNNIIIGDSINPPSETTSNYLSIANLLYGDLSNMRIGLGVQSPQALVHLRGGSATTPAIIINQGTLTNTPVANSLEYNGNRLFLTTSSGERKEIAFRGE